jgi:hypothetical protein
MYRGQERCMQGFGGETFKKHHFEDLGIDGITILKGIFQEIGLERGAWIGLN